MWPTLVNMCIKWIIDTGRRVVSVLGVLATFKDCLAVLVLCLTICFNKLTFILFIFYSE